MEYSQIEAIVTQLINRVVVLENEVKQLKGVEQRIEVPASIQYLNPIPNEVDTVDKEYPSVENAPKWMVKFVISTSKGFIDREFVQNAFSEKQAIFLSRNEKLFDEINGFVKQKLIEPKWKIAKSVAEKID